MTAEHLATRQLLSDAGGEVLDEPHALRDILDQLGRLVFVLDGHHPAPLPFMELLEQRDHIALSGAEGHILAVTLA